MIAIQPQSRQILGINQQTYQSLKASMSLNLRRQLLIAVCDDVTMQAKLAAQLEADLAHDSLAPARLVFDPQEGNLPQQVAHWVRQTMRSGTLPNDTWPSVQVLGIEQMTRQSAIAQNYFLRSLEMVEALLPRLNTSLLVWLPWPWLRTIQQSSPTFWTWRSGVFEFVSDPSPLYPTTDFERTDFDRTNFERTDFDRTDFDRTDLERDIATAPPSAPPSAAALTALANTDAEPIAVGGLYGECESDIEDIDLISEMDWPSVQSNGTQSNSTQSNSTQSNSTQSDDTQLHEVSGLQSVVSSRAGTHSQSPDQHPDQHPDQYPDQPPDQPQDRPKDRPQGQPPSTSQSASPHQILLEKQSSADDHFAKGLTYRQQIESGARDLAVIESAIAAYEQGLVCLDNAYANTDWTSPNLASSDLASPDLATLHLDWASALNDVGTLYWLKAQQLSDPQQSVACMLHSVELYQAALAKIAPQQTSTVALTEQLYSNIGAVYSMLATYEEPISYLQQAINAYLQAVPLVSVMAAPEEYATLQNSLGSVYWKLSHYEQATLHLHQAIAAYNEAILGYDPKHQPLDYAAVQNNLGITYWSLAQHENPSELLKYAIAAYQDALRYRTPTADPGACAITYNNLALAYWDLSKTYHVVANHGANDSTGHTIGHMTSNSDLEQKRRYQKNAITAFEAAIRINRATHTLSSTDSAAIYHCLGDVHGQMAQCTQSIDEVANSLHKSLYSYLQALEGIDTDDPAYPIRLNAVIENIKAHYERLGIAGQQAALNQVPPTLISQVMTAL
ncbi:MAG: hypothetical protein HC800_09490 [Phormidesmis sp. RL_2_1]|nr:hypothetical protein [Phormidesmis sp. RL_2_1]